MFTKTPECPTCVLYREWLEKESIEKRHYQSLLFKKLGMINEVNEAPEAEADWPVIQRSISLSEVRRHLEQQSREKARSEPIQAPSTRVAAETELTEGERLFQERLSEVQQESDK